MTSFAHFLSPLSFAVPQWPAGSAWTEHGPFGAWIVGETKPRVVVELGAYRGYSFAMFCQAMQEAGIDGRAIAVDTWAGDEHGGFYSDKVYRELKAYTDRTYPQRAELLRMTFAEALPHVADQSVDLLHVDGRHFYEDVKEDFTSWIPKLSDRAVVLFHDTQVRDRGFGVYKYWAELVAQYPTFEFHHENGLGVLGLGARQTPSLSALFALPPAEQQQVRLAYQRLGAGIKAMRTAEKVTRRRDERRAFRREPVQYVAQLLRGRLGRSG